MPASGSHKDFPPSTLNVLRSELFPSPLPPKRSKHACTRTHATTTTAANKHTPPPPPLQTRVHTHTPLAAGLPAPVCAGHSATQRGCNRCGHPRTGLRAPGHLSGCPKGAAGGRCACCAVQRAAAGGQHKQGVESRGQRCPKGACMGGRGCRGISLRPCALELAKLAARALSLAGLPC